MFVSKTAFTSDRPIPLAISFDIRLSPPHDFSRSRTPGDSENSISDAGVSGENLPPLAEQPPPGRRRISCCRRPRPGSVRQGGRRSFSRRYRLMITLPGQRSTTSLKTLWSRLRRALATVPSVRVYSSCRIPETSLDATLASLRANLRLSGRDGLRAVPLIYFPPGSKERKRATDGAPHER
jgi:hypothetical protein